MATQYWQQDPANKEKVKASALKAAATRKKMYGGKRPGWPPKPGTPAYNKLDRKEKLRVSMQARWAEKRAAGDTGRLDKPKVEASAAHSNGTMPVLTRSPRGFAKDAVAYLAIEGAKMRLVALDQEREMLLMFIARKK